MAVDIIARAMAAEASSGGKDVDYGSVTNKPQINGITLEGNKTTSDLGIGEIIELKGTEENPIELANIGEPGIYKISGYFKPLLTSLAADIGNDIILEVAKSNDAISQHYWAGNSAFRMMVRVTISGLPFTENFHKLSQDGDIENYNSIDAYSLITSLTLSNYLGRGYMGKVLLDDLKTADKNSLVNAINELVDIKQDKLTAGSGIKIEDNVISALGGGSGAFPSIDATGETEINLDDYLDDGTWIIKGHNVKQIKEYSYTPAKETNWAILEIKTQNWLSNGYVYQILQFPIMAFNNGGLQKQLNYGIRQIKPSIESSFKDYIIPISMTNYYDSFPSNGYQSVLSAAGSYNMYKALMSYLTNNINNKPRLSGLNTTDKTSLVNAINELVDIKQDKLIAGSGIKIEDNVISASGGGSAGITVLEGTEEAPVNLQNLTEAGLYFVKNYYVPSASYAKGNEDMLIINYLTSSTYLIQMSISSDSRGRFYWRTRMYDKTTKTWDKNDFPSRYNDIGELNGDNNYYNGKAIINYYGNKTKLETTNKNNLVNAINEINAKISSGTLATNLAEVQGYDATKTQVLKNINGQFTWVDEN